MKKISIVFAILLTLLNASPAYNGVIEFQQKDGSTFKGVLNGDEYFSWVEGKSDGSIIIYNHDSKNYEYAMLKAVNEGLDLFPSGVKVSMENNVSHSSSFFNKSKLYEIWTRKRKKIVEKKK